MLKMFREIKIKKKKMAMTHQQHHQHDELVLRRLVAF